MADTSLSQNISFLGAGGGGGLTSQRFSGKLPIILKELSSENDIEGYFIGKSVLISKIQLLKHFLG